MLSLLAGLAMVFLDLSTKAFVVKYGSYVFLNITALEVAIRVVSSGAGLLLLYLYGSSSNPKNHIWNSKAALLGFGLLVGGVCANLLSLCLWGIRIDWINLFNANVAYTNVADFGWLISIVLLFVAIANKSRTHG